MIWKEALLSWACLLDTNIPDEENKKLSSPVWYSPKVSKMELYLPQWFNKGIVFVSDLIDSQGKFFSHHDLISKYSGPYNFLDYHRVRQCVNNFIGESDISTKHKAHPSRNIIFALQRHKRVKRLL